MSREPEPELLSDDEPPEPTGHVGSTRPGTLVAFALVGLVVGWLLRPVGVSLHGSAPTVGWLPVLTLAFVAAIIGFVAFSTHRALHRHAVRLEPHHAVNRLVLAKSCALAGAMVAGGYFGFALSWLGLTEADLARTRLLRALVGGVAASALVAASLLLERACRVDRSRRP